MLRIVLLVTLADVTASVAMTSRPALAEEPKAVLITGASTGLGRAVARQLMQCADLRLILTARETSLSRFDELGLEETDRVHLRPLRVNTDAERREVVQEIDEKWGGVDVLVNNAGVAYRAVLEHLREGEMDRQMEINFSAPLQLIRLVLPGMRQRKSGKIINVSSVSGMLAMPTMAKRLNMLDPMTLPMATSACRRNAAITVVASSGSEVPMATRVRPITSSVTPMSRAISWAPSIKRWAPKGKPVNPKAKYAANRHLGI